VRDSLIADKLPGCRPSDERSTIMRAVPQKDSKPEMVVRRVLHRLGYRFRLHRRDLPGTPDIVLPAHRAAIFVHGCFWHRHRGCRLASSPRTRADFWQSKFDRNVERDAAATLALEGLRWRVFIVWECETRDPARMSQMLEQEIASEWSPPGLKPLRRLAPAR
jgi:DNA mismatch endonuclease (patch repair protein)